MDPKYIFGVSLVNKGSVTILCHKHDKSGYGHSDVQTFSKYNFLNSGYPNTEIYTENKSNCCTITLPSLYCSICEKVKNELTLNAAELGQYGAQLRSKLARIV